jgi:endo-1,4-beta-xylanase
VAGAFAAAVPLPAAPATRPRRVPFGAAIQAEYFDDPGYRALFRDHCDIVLPMNELKFALVHPERERFDFGPADRLLDFARRNGKRSRGHAIVWWDALPPWLTALSGPREVETELRRHVEAVVGRYAGRLESWDVVNEVVAHEAPFDQPLRDTFWQRALGSRHIPVAFQAVAAADPKAKLVINDYDLEFRGDRHDRRRATVLEIVRQLQDAGIRVDAVGLQAHLYAEQEVDVEALARFGEELKRLGLGLLVTELDVIDWKIAGGPAAQDAAAGRIVGDLLDGVFAAGSPLAVIAWGMTDRHSWVDDAMPHGDGAPSRPLPFDADYREKRWFRLVEERLRRS